MTSPFDTNRKSPRPSSFSAPVPATPAATRASSALATAPISRTGKFAFNTPDTTSAAGFCVHATRWIPASRPRCASRSSACSTALPPVANRSASSSIPTTSAGLLIPSRSRRSISLTSQLSACTPSAVVVATRPKTCGSSASGPNPRPFGSISTSCTVLCRLNSANDSSTVRTSAVLPDPVVPATNTCTTSGLDKRSNSGVPCSSTPNSAVTAGTFANRSTSGAIRTAAGCSRGTSTWIAPFCRYTRADATPSDSAISSASPVTFATFVSAPVIT